MSLFRPYDWLETFDFKKMTSSAAAQKLQTSAEATWNHLEEYVKSETAYARNDYKTLQVMNENVSERLKGNIEELSSIGVSFQSLNNSLFSLEDYFKEIDLIYEKVTELEKVAVGLDAYTRNLETKYKVLLKQH